VSVLGIKFMILILTFVKINLQKNVLLEKLTIHTLELVTAQVSAPIIRFKTRIAVNAAAPLLAIQMKFKILSLVNVQLKLVQIPVPQMPLKIQIALALVNLQNPTILKLTLVNVRLLQKDMQSQIQLPVNMR